MPDDMDDDGAIAFADVVARIEREQSAKRSQIISGDEARAIAEAEGMKRITVQD